MGKLVRDRIPEIIEADGRTPMVWTLEPADYEQALMDKLLEESEELRGADLPDRLEEAADVYEVLRAIAHQLGTDMAAVAARAAEKRAERGGFEERLWLEG